MLTENNQKIDQKTANAFDNSWNNLPLGSVYDEAQFTDWLSPITENDIKNKTVLEMGCGNGSLMVHMAKWKPLFLEGVDLGDSTETAIKNLSSSEYKNWKITKKDLISYVSNGFDFVYCIGVLHHLKNPQKGFEAVLRNTKPGGKFHCWVYAREGNAVIIYFVDPVRKLASKLPWWVTKYFIATALVSPYFIYAKLLKFFKDVKWLKKMPLFEYSLWIAKREFAFFRHVAFDQLVTPQTTYLDKETIESWLKCYNEIDKESTYIIFRNGNSWKFGGNKKV